MKVSDVLDSPSQDAVPMIAEDAGLSDAAQPVVTDVNAETQSETMMVTETSVTESVQVENNANEKKVYVSVQKQAEFPGGVKGMLDWLSVNIRYPQDAAKADKEGRVVVKFVINPDGSVSDATVLRGIDPSLDAEALRVVNDMPNWSPAEVDGEKVASYFTIPVSFKLAPEKKSEE